MTDSVLRPLITHLMKGVVLVRLTHLTRVNGYNRRLQKRPQSASVNLRASQPWH
jgi:hypothetical protein